LSEVFSRIVKNHPRDAYEKFEEISTLVKRTHLQFSDPKRDSQLNSVHRNANRSDEAAHWIKQSKDLLNEVRNLNV